MDIQFFLRSVTVVALASFFFLTSACSKNETASEASTPSPSATAAVSPTVTPVPAGSPFADVQLRMRDLESKLDNIFSESYRDFGTLFGPTVFGSSVDLREQKDKYVARVYPPNGDTSKVNARIDSGVLRITIEGTQTTSGTTTSENDEQVITLPEPVLADQMQIERK